MTATMHVTIQPQFRTIDGLSIRFGESEERGDDALLLSPWPESLLAFEPMWARLAEHAHLVAVDLPGFGHSERRDELLSPRAMGEFVIRLVDALGLERPHAVGTRHRHRGPALRRGRKSKSRSEPRHWQWRRRLPAPTGRSPEGLGRGP